MLLALFDSTDLPVWGSELSREFLATRLGQLSHFVGTELHEGILALAQTMSLGSSSHFVDAELREEIFALVQSDGDGGKKPNAANVRKLGQLMAELRPLVVSTVGQERNKGVRFVSSDYASLLLLVGLLQRLEWPQTILHSTFGATHGLRAITYIFAGLGLAMLKRFGEKPLQLGPGLALFAGWMDEPVRAGLQRFFAMGTSMERRALLDEIVPQREMIEKDAESWSATLERMAEFAIREFASRVRGFRQASRSFVVKHFFALPGRIRVEDSCLVITLAASPFHVALHLSGWDETVDDVRWLGGRRLEFQLEGL
jgi:hypothetical protein